MTSGKIKVALMPRHGPFLLTEKQIELLAAAGINVDSDGRIGNTCDFISRHHPALIAAIEQAPGFGFVEAHEIDGNRYHIDQSEWGETLLTPESVPWVVVGNVSR